MAEERVQRRLAAILVADVAGYSRLTGTALTSATTSAAPENVSYLRRFVAWSMLRIFVSAILVLAVAPAIWASDPESDVRAGVEAYESNDFETALNLWRPHAEQGHARAQSWVGHMYRTGQGVEENAPEALKWYRKAAEQGDVWAEYMLGLMYDVGIGVPEDPAKAAVWYRKAAEQGDIDAQQILALMYQEGRGVPQDDAEAANWFQRAANLGTSFPCPEQPSRTEESSAPDFAIDRAEEVLELAEAAAAEIPDPIMPIGKPQLAEKLARAKEDVEGYLCNHPDDVHGLVVLARLLYFHSIYSPIIFGGGDEAVIKQQLATYKLGPQRAHAALDRALTLSPKNGEIYYWKARLYGSGTPALGQFDPSFLPDYEKAIDFTRQAVELSPQIVRYRETLAIYLAADGRPEEAGQVLKEVRGEHDPISVLLEDRENFPLPPGAVSWPKAANHFLHIMMGTRFGSALRGYSSFRVSAYFFRMNFREAEAFYRDRITDFPHLPTTKRDWGVGYELFLRTKGNQLIFVTTGNEMRGTPIEGFYLLLANSTEGAGLEPPVAVGEDYFVVIVFNFRSFESP